MIIHKRMRPGHVSGLEGYDKDNSFAKIITPHAYDMVASWVNGSVNLIVYHSLEELVDNRVGLSEAQFNLVRNALKERPWVCLISRPVLKPIEGLVVEAMPGFNHKGGAIIPVRYVSERHEQGGCPH